MSFLWLLHFYFLNSLDGTGHNFWHIRIPTMFYTILESWDIGQNENHIFRSKLKPKKIAESHDDAPLWDFFVFSTCLSDELYGCWQPSLILAKILFWLCGDILTDRLGQTTPNYLQNIHRWSICKVKHLHRELPL